MQNFDDTKMFVFSDPDKKETQLSEDAWGRLMEILENPPKPNKAIKSFLSVKASDDKQ